MCVGYRIGSGRLPMHRCEPRWPEAWHGWHRNKPCQACLQAAGEGPEGLQRGPLGLAGECERPCQQWSLVHSQGSPELGNCCTVMCYTWVQVEGLLDRAAGSVPVVQYVVSELERLGYQSWAQRILNTAGDLAVRCPHARQHCLMLTQPCRHPESSLRPATMTASLPTAAGRLLN